jgi:fatty acid desaturase
MTAATVETKQFIHGKSRLWNTLAIAYTGFTYLGGIALFLLPQVGLNLLGVVVFTHSLLVSAYLAHELMHGNLFESRALNVAWGNVMLWINGAIYTPFNELMRLHIAHHVDRVDFYRFNLAAFLEKLPAPLRMLLLGLEWLYIPSLAFFVRFRLIAAPFLHPEHQEERLRTAILLLVRGSLFALLGFLSPKALGCYFLSYVAMITVLRFMDAFQHTYEVFALDVPLPKRDRSYEQANTFSNVVSLRHRWLNLLLLNFGYHNAHHELMKCPWHSLPALDRTLFTGAEPHYIPLGRLLGNYHRYRVSRIFSGQGSAVNEAGEPSLDAFYGGIEVSFLVPS